jgi:hypothetical protein
MDNKIAGLYLNLAKALNALDEAGELITLATNDIEGNSGVVEYDWDSNRWNVAQA